LIYYLVDFANSPEPGAARTFINVDLGFDEAQYGVLASLGFAFLFSAASLFAGGVVDRVDPRFLLPASGVVWSSSMFWQASGQSFPDILIARMVSGLAQAFCNPAAYAVLSKVYPEEQRASVNGIYSSGLYLGGGLAALSIILNTAVGWRELCAIVGGIGVFLAALTFIILRPVAPQASLSREQEEETELLLAGVDDEEVGSKHDEMEQTMVNLRRLLTDGTTVWLLVATGLRFMAGFIIGVWIIPFYRAQYGGAIGAEFALLKASVNGIAGSVSASAGGILTDKLTASNPSAELWVPAAGSNRCISVPTER